MLNCADLKAQLFSECLRKVGYRDVDGIDESYLISLVSSSPFAEHFITWITQKCSERNYVDDYTLKEYKEMVENSHPILSHDQLLLMTMDSDSFSADSLRKSIDDLKEDHSRVDTRCKKLEWEIKMLDTQQVKLDDIIEDSDPERSCDVTTNKQLLDRIEMTSYEINKSNEELEEVVRRTMEDFKERYSQNMVNIADDSYTSNSALMTNIDLTLFEQIENQVSEELSNYMRKSMIKNVQDMAKSIRTLMKCELIDIKDHEEEASVKRSLDLSSDKQSGLMRADDLGAGDLEMKNDTKFISNQSEFKRLRLVIPEAELLRMQAIEQEVYSRIGLMFTKKFREDWSAQSLPTSAEQLLQILCDLEPKCAAVQKKLISYTREKIPEIINKSSELQVNSIISGNYNLVLCRQEYCILLQKKVIENLVQQKARGELIALLYDEQEDSATSIFKTVASVSYSLKQRKSQFYDRMIALKKDDHKEIETIPNKDSFLMNIYNLLDVNNEETPTFTKCHENAINLNNRLRVISDLNDEREVLVKTKYLQFSEQMSKIGEISTDYKQHTGEVGKQIKIMNVSRFNQEEQASSLFQSIMQKQKLISSDKCEAYRRKIFELFILDQEKLRDLLKQAEKNYKASLNHR